MTIEQKLRFLREHDMLNFYVLLGPTAVDALPCELTNAIRGIMYLTVLVYGHTTPGHILIDGLDTTVLPPRHQHETSVSIPVQDGVFVYTTRYPFGHAGTRPLPHVEATDISADGLRDGVIAVVGIEAKPL